MDKDTLDRLSAAGRRDRLLMLAVSVAFALSCIGVGVLVAVFR